jgi:lipooligosaccharide transport system ATP-binding protein
VLTTHYMDEAEQLCDRLVIMDGGHIVAEGSPRELIERHSTREVVELRFPHGEARDAAVPKMQAAAARIEALPDRVLVYTDDGDAVPALVAHHGIDVDSVYARRSTLEDVFLILTGRTLLED